MLVKKLKKKKHTHTIDAFYLIQLRHSHWSPAGLLSEYSSKPLIGMRALHCSITSMLFNCLYHFKVKASVGQTCRNRQKIFLVHSFSYLLLSWKCLWKVSKEKLLQIFFRLIFILFYWILTPCAGKTNTIVHISELFDFISKSHR